MALMSVSRRRTAMLATVVLAPAALSGCGALGLGDDSGSSASGGADDVVAAFYPLQFVTQRVVGDLGEVDSLTRPGGEPHDLELSVAQTGEIADADLVVYLEGFQPAVDDAVAQSAADRGLDVAPSVDLLPASGEDEHDHGDEGATEEHSEEEHSEEGHSDEEHSDEDHAHEEEGEEGEEHAHGDTDPHFWQDPLRLADAADAVADRLAELDPDNAGTYEDNAAALRTDLEALDEEYTTGLASCERDVVVVNHGAFGYLARYGLDFHDITGLSPDAEPTPAALAELQELIATDGVTTVFSERLASTAAADSLAADAGVSVEVLDPIEGLTDETADEDYLSLMRSNLEALKQANGC